MAFAGDVADDLEAVGQTHLGDLAECRVRLLRCRRIDARADATLLRAPLHVARFFAVCLLLPRLADQLTDCRHSWPFEKRTFDPQLPRAGTQASGYFERRHVRKRRSTFGSRSLRRSNSAEDRSESRVMPLSEPWGSSYGLADVPTAFRPETSRAGRPEKHGPTACRKCAEPSLDGCPRQPLSPR